MTRCGRAMARLESISAVFDYSCDKEYVACAASYIRNSNWKAVNAESPFFDVTLRTPTSLPSDISARLDAFLAQKPDYPPTTRKACLWFLRHQHAIDGGSIPLGPSPYEPLITLLELGGDFYEHNGAVCIRDAAMIPFVR